MKRIGNIFLGILLCTYTYVCAQQDIEVRLSATNAQHMPLQEVGVNKPFYVEVTVNGVGSTENVYLETHGQFDMRTLGSTSQMNSINGVSSKSIIHQYSGRAKEFGTLTLGPAVVTVNGQIYTSNALEVSVVEQPIERITLTEPKLELVVPKGPIVVGQTLPIALRFYHLGTAQLSGISSNQIPGFSDDSHEGPFAGTAKVDGVPYEYVEWRTHVVAHQEGTFVFEPARAVYSMPSRERTSLWQQLSDRFSFGLQQYETYSPVVQVVVEPLPPHTGHVDAVGSLTNLHATVNQTVAKQGEGIVYTLELMGDMSLKEMNHPTLTLPSTLTAYESKSTLMPSNPRNPQEVRKQFEYVLQAKTPGILELPEQTITFYDPIKQQYAHLSSESITLNISSDASRQKKEEAQQPELEESADKPNAPEYLPLFSQGVAEFRTDTGMSDLLFWLFIAFVIAGLLIQWGIYIWQCYRARNFDYLRLKAAFHTARKNIKRAASESRDQDLYGVFTQLYADRHSRTQADVTADDMQDWLGSSSLPSETKAAWKQFMLQLQTQAFGNEQKQNTLDVNEQAQQWIAVLEKLV